MQNYLFQYRVCYIFMIVFKKVLGKLHDRSTRGERQTEKWRFLWLRYITTSSDHEQVPQNILQIIIKKIIIKKTNRKNKREGKIKGLLGTTTEQTFSLVLTVHSRLNPSSWASWGYVSVTWPCREDRLVHCGESAGDNWGTTSLGAAVVWTQESGDQAEEVGVAGRPCGG